MERAAESYSKVVDLAPLHLDARISLSILQQQLSALSISHLKVLQMLAHES